MHAYTYTLFSYTAMYTHTLLCSYIPYGTGSNFYHFLCTCILYANVLRLHLNLQGYDSACRRGGTEPKISYYVTSPMQVRNQTNGWQSATDIHFSVLCNKNSLPMHTVTKLPFVLMPCLPIPGVSSFKDLS